MGFGFGSNDPNSNPSWGYGNSNSGSFAVGQPDENSTYKTPSGGYAVVDNRVNDSGNIKSGYGDFMGTTTHNDMRPAKADPNLYQWGRNPQGADFDVNRYQNMGAAAQQRGLDPTAQAQQQQARGYQNLAAGEYINTLRGNSPSLAQLQMQQGLGQSQANAMGMANSARGGGNNQVAAMRAAMQTNANQANSTNMQQAQLRAQEVDMARRGLLGAGSAMRSGDFTNQNQYLQNRNANDQFQLGMEGDAFNTRRGQLEADMAQGQTNAQMANAGMDRSLNQAQNNAKQDNPMSAIGGIAGGIIGALSDERTKTNIVESDPFGTDPQTASTGMQGPGPAHEDSLYKSYTDRQKDYDFNKLMQNADSKDEIEKSTMMGYGFGKLLSSDERGKKNKTKIHDFVNKLQPYSYEYKDPEPGMEGRQHGVMAQDMEKSDAGKSAIIETQRGKAIDIKKGLSLALASIAELKNELNTLKSGKGKRGGRG